MLSERKIIAAEVALAIAIFALVVYYLPPETMEFDMSITVGDHIGFDVNTSAILFGETVPDSWVNREVIVSNTADYRKSVRFSMEGNITRFVALPADAFVKANGNLTTNIRAFVPYDAEKGYYEGKLVISLRRAL